MVSTKLLFSAGIDLSVKVFKNSLTATYEDHIQNNSSDIINIVFNKCNDVIYGIMLPISTLVSASILILGVIGFLVFINPFVMITSFIAFGLVYSFILSFTSLRVKFYSKPCSGQLQSKKDKKASRNLRYNVQSGKPLHFTI